MADPAHDHQYHMQQFWNYVPEPNTAPRVTITKFFDLWRKAEGGETDNLNSATRLINYLPQEWRESSVTLADNMTIRGDFGMVSLNFPNYIHTLLLQWIFPPQQPPVNPAVFLDEQVVYVPPVHEGNEGGGFLIGVPIQQLGPFPIDDDFPLHMPSPPHPPSPFWPPTPPSMDAIPLTNPPSLYRDPYRPLYPLPPPAYHTHPTPPMDISSSSRTPYRCTTRLSTTPPPGSSFHFTDPLGYRQALGSFDESEFWTSSTSKGSSSSDN